MFVAGFLLCIIGIITKNTEILIIGATSCNVAAGVYFWISSTIMGKDLSNGFCFAMLFHGVVFTVYVGYSVLMYATFSCMILNLVFFIVNTLALYLQEKEEAAK